MLEQARARGVGVSVIAPATRSLCARGRHWGRRGSSTVMKPVRQFGACWQQTTSRWSPVHPNEVRPACADQVQSRQFLDLRGTNPNVSQGGGERAKSSSIRRRSELNLRKSSYGPSPAGLLAVLAPSVSIFCQGKTHHSPNSACCPNSSRYSLPFSQQRRAVTCNCRYTWRNSSR